MNGWQSLGFKSYTDYILSDIWIERKMVLIELRPYCEICKEPKKYWRHGKGYYKVKGRWIRKIVWLGKEFTVHHKSYYNVGNEDVDDLQVVCNDCHNTLK